MKPPFFERALPLDHRTLAEAVALMRAYDSIHLETSTLLATGALKQVIDWVGAERVLYGSGAPARPMAAAFGAVRYADLSDEHRALVLGGNAKVVAKEKAGVLSDHGPQQWHGHICVMAGTQSGELHNRCVWRLAILNGSDDFLLCRPDAEPHVKRHH